MTGLDSSPLDQPACPAVARWGRFLPKDPDGVLLNDTSWELIEDPWRDAVLAGADRFVQAFGPQFVSLAIRGSVPRGLARFGVSDLDFVAVVDIDETLDQREVQRVALEILDRHRCASRVDLEWVGIDEMFLRPHLRFYQAILKIQSLHLWGRDLTTELPDVRVDRSLQTSVPFIESRASYALERLDQGSDIDQWIAWIMRAIIRSAFDLVSIETGEFTRDLWLCVDAYCLVFESDRKRMATALDLAVNPGQRVDDARHLVLDLVPRITAERDRQGLKAADFAGQLERKYGPV